MTMFTRTDKPAETNANGPIPPRDKIETPTPAPAQAAVEPKRPVASTQTISSVSSNGQVPRVSLISKALKITGQLESTEDIQIEGEIDGDVRGVAVKVGSNAKVKGTVYGDEVELSGTVEGKIEAKKVILTSTAHMAGDVVHQDITIHSGAYIDGHCRPEYGKSDAKRVIPVNKPAVVQ